jgi:WG containing repeat
MRHIILIFLFIYLSQATSAQNTHWLVKPIVPSKNFFYEERNQSPYIVFEKNKKKGVVTTLGEVIIEPIYDNYLYVDHENLFFSASGENKNDLINQEGKIIGAAFAQKTILSPEYIMVNENNLWGIIDKNGNIVEKPIYDSFDQENKTEKEYDLVLKNSKTSKKIHILKAKTPEADVYRNNYELSAIKGYRWITKTGEYSKIEDLNGKTMIPPVYRDIYYLGNGRFIATEKNKRGLISLKNDTILPFIYKDISHSNGFYILEKGDSSQILNEKMETVASSFDGTKYGYCDKKPYFTFKKGGKVGLIDTSGNVVLPLTYQELYSSDESFARVRNDKKIALFSFKTMQLASPFFSEIQDIGGGLYMVKDSLYGIYNVDNQSFTMPTKHVDKIRLVDDYFAGYYYDKKDKKNYAAVYDRKGSKVVEYDNVYIRMFSNATFLVGKNEKFVQINAQKDTLRRFTERKDLLEFYFSNWLKVKKDDKSYFINACDTIGKETYYDNADFYTNPDYVAVSKDKKHGIVSAENKPILPLVFDSPVSVCERLKDEKNAKVQLFIVQKEKKYGLYGKEQILPTVFDTIYQYDGNFVVSLKGKSGMIGFESLLQAKVKKSVFPTGFENLFDANLNVLVKAKQDSILIFKAECDSISSKIFQSIKKLGYESFFICGPNDAWCKIGMSKFFKETPKALNSSIARNPLQIQLENQHIQLYHADVKYLQNIDNINLIGLSKSSPVLREAIIEQCYWSVLSQNKGKYKEKTASKLMLQFLKQYFN